MKNLLSLKVPGSNGSSTEIVAPSGIPTGGLSGSGGKAILWGLEIMLLVIILLTLGFLIYGGMNWITSGGDKAKLETARKTITYAVIGLIICFVSFFAIMIIGGIFKVDLLNIKL